MLSICVTIKNRAAVSHNSKVHPLFTRFIECYILATKHLTVPTELIISDWGSTDKPIGWTVQRLANTSDSLTIVRMPGDAPFSRGEGLNVCARWARYPVLFFMDADMIFTYKVLQHALDAARVHKAYFPICWSFNDAAHTRGSWRVNGHGIVAVSDDIYHQANKWDEYKQWGSEDLHFFERTSKLVPIVRNKETELRHQWHPQLNSTKGT